MPNFRDHHLLSLLSEFDQSPLPIDLFASLYFKAHKAIGSKDRLFISEMLYRLIRYKGLLDAILSPITPTWEKRYLALQKYDPIEKESFAHLPLHLQASCPKELFDLLVTAYGDEEALKLTKVLNGRAPTTIRVNTLKISRDALFEEFSKRFKVQKTALSPVGITFLERVHFYSMPEFTAGYFEVQDEASQLASELAPITPKDLVLDFCAGSGGKALALGALMQGKGQLFLHDVRKKALLEAKVRLKRAGIQNCQIIHADEKIRLDKLKKKIDLVFIDAPCSGSGTLRRNPDMKWRFSLQMLKELCAKQRLIFEKAQSFVKPSGLIIYATCSMLPEENEEQIAYFCKTYNLEIVKTFKSFPTDQGMDGFFATSLKKKANPS
jgi:16S rRNA C967 or C1407 C5-methylase (RsmB/RsmF family)